MVSIAPKYSIVIPTRNGGNYIQHAVESILSQEYDDCELLVSVNYSVDDTLEKLAKFQDRRLKIISPPQELPISSHYEWCLQQVRGQWIIVIGDDDGVMPFFFKELDRLIRDDHSGNLVYSIRRAHYFWPDRADISNNCVIELSGARSLRKIVSWRMILDCFLGFESHVHLPEIYACNVIHYSILERIRSLSGGLIYYDQSPDVYSGVAVAMVCQSYGRYEFPLIWVGSSSKSLGFAFTAQRLLQNDHRQDLIREIRNDCFNLSYSGTPSVASEVGNRLLCAAHSEPLFILSALLRLPFLPDWLARIKPLLVWVAFSAQWRLTKRIPSPDKKIEVTSAFKDQAAKLKLSMLTLEIGAWLISSLEGLRILRLKILPAFKAKFAPANRSYDPWPSFHSEDSRAFPTILEAGVAAVDWYQEVQSHIKHIELNQ
jgi:glycosyltransferase involved in cell wall biosynthesis